MAVTVGGLILKAEGHNLYHRIVLFPQNEVLKDLLAIAKWSGGDPGSLSLPQVINTAVSANAVVQIKDAMPVSGALTIGH
ncbi:MAG: hypothetical protein ABIX01_16850 [Chitinophagaceae bacterium]